MSFVSEVIETCQDDISLGAALVVIAVVGAFCFLMWLLLR